MSFSTGQLFLTALDSSAPVLILIGIGAVLNLTKIVPGKSFRQLNNITFKFALTISAIYTIGRQSFDTNDLKMILGLILISIVGFIINIPLCFLYAKSERIFAYAFTSSITLLNNAVFSGIPVFSGIYGHTLAARYAYIQLLVGFSFALLFIYLQFGVAQISAQKQTDMIIFKANDTTSDTKTLPKQNIIVICLLKTIKQPLLISILISIIYNGIGTQIPFLKNLPPYLEQQFSNFGSISAPLGLLSLGMFSADLIKQKRDNTVKTKLIFQIISFIVVCAYKSFILPLILIFIAKMLGIDHLTAEINAAIYSSPTAVFSYAICDEYGFGAGWAGLQCSLGVIVSMCAIPVIQKVSRAVYGVSEVFL